MPALLSPRFAFHLIATLALAAVAALVWHALGLPLPWMIGPLVATALASIAGLPTTTAIPLRNGGQWIIGTALGLYFTPEVTRMVLGLWWAVLLAIVWALVLGGGFSQLLHRMGLRGLDAPPQTLRATSYFAGAIGGASEMTLLAERAGARSDLVAGAHSLRMLIVTVGLPLAFAWADLHGSDPSVPGVREVRWLPLVVLMGATFAGCLLLRLMRWANPWFIGALAAAMALSMAGVELSALPSWASNGAQLVIGVSLGVRFRREFLRQAPRWMAAVAVGTLVMIALSVVFAWALAWATGLSMATLVLGTAPGGISEMAITAKVLQLGVPMVTAFQVCRLVAVLLLVAPLYRWLERRADSGQLSA
jgi:membrane AbrB-like protein